MARFTLTSSLKAASQAVKGVKEAADDLEGDELASIVSYCFFSLAQNR